MTDIPQGVDPFEEQGWRVYEVSDYEWYAARDKDMAVADALKGWGMPIAEGFPDGLDDVDAVNLDLNKININEDESPEGPIITFREQLQRLIAMGGEVAGFFCGVDA